MITINHYWLVVSNMNFIFHHILGMSSQPHWRTPSCFKMVIAPPTSKSWSTYWRWYDASPMTWDTPMSIPFNVSWCWEGRCRWAAPWIPTCHEKRGGLLGWYSKFGWIPKAIGIHRAYPQSIYLWGGYGIVATLQLPITGGFFRFGITAWDDHGNQLFD